MRETVSPAAANASFNEFTDSIPRRKRKGWPGAADASIQANPIPRFSRGDGFTKLRALLSWRRRVFEAQMAEEPGNPEGRSAAGEKATDPVALSFALGAAGQNARVAARAGTFLEGQARLADLQSEWMNSHV
jgi:hypothetical protein